MNTTKHLTNRSIYTPILTINKRVAVKTYYLHLLKCNPVRCCALSPGLALPALILTMFTGTCSSADKQPAENKKSAETVIIQLQEIIG